MSKKEKKKINKAQTLGELRGLSPVTVIFFYNTCTQVRSMNLGPCYTHVDLNNINLTAPYEEYQK